MADCIAALQDANYRVVAESSSAVERKAHQQDQEENQPESESDQEDQEESQPESAQSTRLDLILNKDFKYHFLRQS